MKYVSVDIETTGLDPATCQILSVAMVAEDTQADVPVEALPFVEVVLDWVLVRGSPMAMAMNADLLDRIAHKRNTMPDFTARSRLIAFIETAVGKGNKVTAAGKNFASFDRRFLNELWPSLTQLFHHRSLDPVHFYVRSDDTYLPDTFTCQQRAGTYDFNDKQHDALTDARNVIKLIRASGVFKVGA